MLIVLLGIFIVMIVIGVMVSCISYDSCDFGAFLGIPGILGFIATGIITINVACSLVSYKTVDDKIAMYQEENAKIETQIAEAVERYQQHETDVFTKVAPESSITLVAMYPELKSDKLVEGQIDAYLKNSNKIKELREQKISVKTNRWWLYFGG